MWLCWLSHQPWGDNSSSQQHFVEDQSETEHIASKKTLEMCWLVLVIGMISTHAAGEHEHARHVRGQQQIGGQSQLQQRGDHQSWTCSTGNKAFVHPLVLSYKLTNSGGTEARRVLKSLVIFVPSSAELWISSYSCWIVGHASSNSALERKNIRNISVWNLVSVWELVFDSI